MFAASRSPVRFSNQGCHNNSVSDSLDNSYLATILMTHGGQVPIHEENWFIAMFGIIFILFILDATWY
jgi:hypothetical protein